MTARIGSLRLLALYASGAAGTGFAPRAASHSWRRSAGDAWARPAATTSAIATTRIRMTRSYARTTAAICPVSATMRTWRLSLRPGDLDGLSGQRAGPGKLVDRARIEDVVDALTRVRRSDPQPDPGAAVAPAVRHADHAAHHVVGDLDRQLDRAARRGHR